MSSQYGPNRLGYTGVTMAMTISSNNVNWSKSLKIVLVRIVFCNRKHEVGIASNRKSARYGEFVSRPSTYRPSRHGNWFIGN